MKFGIKPIVSQINQLLISNFPKHKFLIKFYYFNRDAVKHSTPPGISKVEDKKRQQEKKNKLLNISAFWKPPSKPQGYDDLLKELIHDNEDLDKVKSENRDLMQLISKTPAEKDVKKCIHSLVSNILQNRNAKRIEELSEITQNFYQVFGKRMENSPNYAGISPEVRDLY